MFSNNVLITFSFEKSDLLPVPGRSGINLYTHSMHSLMKDFVTSYNDVCAVSTKRLVEQKFINKI